jgi:hypothetical protein
MSDVVTTVGFSVDSASVGEVKSAANAVQAELQKIGKADAFKELGKEFAKLAKETGSTGDAVAALQVELTKLKASDAEIKSAALAFDQQSKAIDKATESAKKLADEEARVANEAASASAAQSAQSGGGGKGGLSTFGSQIRNLPSVQIPGIGIGTDAIGNLARVAGAFQDSGKTASEALQSVGVAVGFLREASTAAEVVQVAGATATTALAGAETAETAVKGGLVIATTGAALSAGALVVALAPIAVIGIALVGAVALLGAAFSDLNKKSQEAAAAIKDRYAAEDKVDTLVRSGATVEEAYKQRADLEAQLADATRRGNEAQAEKTATFANDAAVSGDAAARLRGGSAVYKEYDERIASTQKSAKEAAAELSELNKQIDGGAFAAATAKEKSAKDAEAKEKAEADAAKAQEQAARQAEAAQAKRQQQQDQAAAKEQQAQDKAVREAEQQAEKVKQAQDQISKSNTSYSNKLTDLATTAAQRVEDINKQARDKTIDARQKFNDDLIKLTVKSQQDEAAARLKQQDSAQDAALKQARALEDIENDTAKNARQSLRERNFLAASTAEESGQEALDKAALTTKREAEDKDRAEQRDARDRLIKLDEARRERLNAYNIENRDASTALKRQLDQAALNEQRQEDQAKVAYKREQAELAKHLNELVGLRTAGYAAEAAAAQGRAPDTSALRGGSGSTSTSTTTINDHRSLGITGSFGGMLTVDQLQRMAIKTMQRTAY